MITGTKRVLKGMLALIAVMAGGVFSIWIITLAPYILIPIFIIVLAYEIGGSF